MEEIAASFRPADPPVRPAPGTPAARWCRLRVPTLRGQMPQGPDYRLQAAGERDHRAPARRQQDLRRDRAGLHQESRPTGGRTAEEDPVLPLEGRTEGGD